MGVSTRGDSTVTKAQKAAALDELQRIYNRAEALADTLDPHRTFTGKDETARAIVKACDVILSQASRAASMIRVSGEMAKR